MSRSILAESVAILGIAVVLGTAVHLLRTDTKQKIAFFGRYPDALVYKKPAPPGTGVGPPEVLIKAPQPPGTSSGPKSQPEKTLKVTPGPAPTGSSVPASPIIREINIEEAIEEHKKGGETPFLDARRTVHYERGHIPRAKPFSVWEADIDQRIAALLVEVPADIPVIIYCSGGDCVDSHMLADKLKVAGYRDLRIFVAGFPEWQKRGLPVERSEGAPDSPPGGEEESK